MALSEEWRDRITDWFNELQRGFYRKLEPIQLTGFTTYEQLTREQALDRPCRSLLPGTKWGAKWEYGWFRGEITLPPDAAGKRIVAMIGTGVNPGTAKNVLVLDTGSESLVYLNGQISGATRSRWYRDLISYPNQVLISRSGEPGRKYELFFECYAGHGAMPTAVGPVPPDRIPVPEPPPQQVTIGESDFGIWEETFYQLWLDVKTLWELRENLDPNSLRVAEIDRGLKDFTTILDFEIPYPRMIATAEAARARIKPLLDCVNGTTAATIYAFGHGHIDLAWLWPLAETVRKGARTLANQLELIAEYPEYRFLQSTPALYQMMQAHYPELYGRVKEAVKRGAVIPEGGMWVEADTNIPGGESLIRQFIHGKRFFKTEFGVESQLLWLPDVFGYSGNLPQIMRGCGIKYFATGKLFWNYHGGASFPYNTFIWKGIDGSEVLAHLCDGYSAETSPAPLIRTWETRVQKEGCSARLLPFGWGDGGGGPTRDHLEYLRREKNLEGMPKAKIGSPLEFFKDLEHQEQPEDKYVGELYFQAHRGTFTSQARIKQANRRSELMLREAEFWGAVAVGLKGFKYPRVDLDTAWKKILLNQFHDILPGSAIHRVYEEAATAYREVLDLAGKVTQQATCSLINHAEAYAEGMLTVFNSLSWERTVLVKLPWPSGAAKADGMPLPGQVMDGATFVSLSVPACGWTTIYSASGLGYSEPIRVGEWYLENELLRVELDDRGAITRILDKEADRELITAPVNVFKMYQDIPTRNDAWDIDSLYERTPLKLDEPARLEILQAGTLMGRIRVTRRLHQSQLIQEISLGHCSRTIEFKTLIDWRERHKLLKVNFPVDLSADEAIHEIQFGHIRRPNHKSREFDADRFEVCQHKWTALAESGRGVAILNDGKYGVNVSGNSINLTLLKAAQAPDSQADQGQHEFKYAFLSWNGSFAASPVVRAGYELNSPVVTIRGGAGERSIFTVDAPNVIIETVKPAEDGSTDIILRLYEAKRTATRCQLLLTLPVKAASQTDMLERELAPLTIDNSRITLNFRAFEIKTLRCEIGMRHEPCTP